MTSDLGFTLAFDRDGDEVRSFEHLGELLADDYYKLVAWTFMPAEDSGVEVSTLWYGAPPGMPSYETMIFGGPLDREGQRYSTAEQAALGHQEWVQRVLLIWQPR